tara:strand:+ start:1972 stop:2928 length:957 start_codon:yes stop_codon:yes gene_type:complete
MAFTPFMQGTKAQSIISDYLGGKLESTPNVNSAGMYRNPNFDLRTEQENAGTLDPSALYPNPVIDFTPEKVVDPCQEGFMLVDGICQPIEGFGQSLYQPEEDSYLKARAEQEARDRPYMNIDTMQNSSDEELIDYLKSGWLRNSALGYLPSKGGDVTLASGMFGMPLAGQAMFGNQNDLRRRAMMDELQNRGYFTGNFDKKDEPIFNIVNQPTPNTNTGGIESQLPSNIVGQPVTDVYGDTYQQVNNDGQGSTGYDFTPNPNTTQADNDKYKNKIQGGYQGNTSGRGGTKTTQTPLTSKKEFERLALPKSRYSGNPFI